ncbi:MAG: WhiB family transcriptional regulator [bacterium]
MSFNSSTEINDWRDLGECVGEDPEDWYPVSGVGADAIRKCNCCMVKAQCLDDALSFEGSQVLSGNRIFGIRAGLMASQRKKLIIEQAERDGLEIVEGDEEDAAA